MASIGGEQQISSNNRTDEPMQRRDSRESSAERKATRDREEKLKLARDRQNEERQRKIEELKAQAEAAQRYREQKEEERRRRMEEMRHRDTEKRHQVEERKRAIMEAEKERRESILRKNQERESRIESKKRERNSIGFAFGSSTPRLLEPADFGIVSSSTFWGQRRSTSISNVAGTSLSRRSSERELNDSGAKKRATSASGTDRNDEDCVDVPQVVFRSVARRKTDLMPTIPSPRDVHHFGSRSSLSNTPKTPGSRSGNVTPGGSVSASRPGSAMSTSTTLSTSGFVNRRPTQSARKPRPSSIAGTGYSLDDIKFKKENGNKPPTKSTPISSAHTTPKRTSNMMSTSMFVTPSAGRFTSDKKPPTKKEPTTPKGTPSRPLSKTASSERLNKFSKEKSKDMSPMAKSAIILTNTNDKTASEKTNLAAKEIKSQKIELNNEIGNKIENSFENIQTEIEIIGDHTAQPALISQEPLIEKRKEKGQGDSDVVVAEVKVETIEQRNEVRELTPPASIQNDNGSDAMTASMIAAKNKITTEEEAKAALAERRRLAREEAERQAEIERQRLEAERLAEIKRQEEEAEQQRLLEEESTRLAQEQRRAEEERLRQAIEEAQQREEDERRKREEEERQRLEREETDRKAKEEAEKQRLEVAERLKREEKEREERRKRVEAIMSRTRRGGGAPTTPNSNPVKDANETPKTNDMQSTESPAQLQSTDNQQEQQQQQPSQSVLAASTESSDSTSSSASTTTPTQVSSNIAAVEPQNSHLTQALYEQSVNDKEAELIQSFSNLIIDENAKNKIHNNQFMEYTNGTLHTTDITNTGSILGTTKNINTVSNGNGHIENINNKNDINLLQDVVTPATNQLIDFSIESQDMNNSVNFNNNNSLLTSNTTNLVTADSHENKDLSLL